MRVVLINPTSRLFEASPSLKKFVAPILPLGLASIAAVLEENGGIEIHIVDQFAQQLSNEALLMRLRELSPDLVGFSCLTSVMDNVKSLVQGLRTFTHATVVLGGIHPTLFAEQLLQEGVADVVIRGEGEMTMLDLCRTLMSGADLSKVAGLSFRQENKVVSNPDRALIEDLDSLPYPAWHLFDFKYYQGAPMLGIDRDLVIPVAGSRGCPYQCAFCAQDKIYPKPRYRRTEAIIAEMEFLHEKYGVRHIGFIDANFPFSPAQGMDFCEKMISRGLNRKLRWTTELRTDLINEELLTMMKKAGVLLLMLGFEAGNNRILGISHKGVQVAQAKKTMSVIKKLKIRTLGLFILGLPGETKDTCLETIRLAKKLDCDIVKFNIATPFPGSPFFAQLYKGKRFELDAEKFTAWYDWGKDGDFELVYVPEGMTQQELIGLQRQAMFEYYMRPKIVLRFLFSGKYSLMKLAQGACILVSKYVLMLLGRHKGAASSWGH